MRGGDGKALFYVGSLGRAKPLWGQNRYFFRQNSRPRWGLERFRFGLQKPPERQHGEHRTETDSRHSERRTEA